SRRRHTSFSRDWSSDVCSSDLGAALAAGQHGPPGGDDGAAVGGEREDGVAQRLARVRGEVADLLQAVGAEPAGEQAGAAGAEVVVPVADRVALVQDRADAGVLAGLAPLGLVRLLPAEHVGDERDRAGGGAEGADAAGAGGDPAGLAARGGQQPQGRLLLAVL